MYGQLPATSRAFWATPACAIGRDVADDRLLAGLVGSPGKGRAIGVGEVGLIGQITPDVKRVRYEIDMRQVRRGKLVLGIANGRVLADDGCVYVAKDMRVGLTAAAS